MFTGDALSAGFEELCHFVPSAEERRKFANSGVAMPDGSFFIRNRGDLQNAIDAVGRATPNAGESEVARRNAVRRHCMKRAEVINAMDMIPDTWNPDGSLKQTGIAVEVEDFLAHYGVKGMRWGVRREDRGSSGGGGQMSPGGGGSAGGSGRMGGGSSGSGQMRPGGENLRLLGRGNSARGGDRVRVIGGKGSNVTVTKSGGIVKISEDAARANGLRQKVASGGTKTLSNQDLQFLVSRMNLESQYGRLSPAHVTAGEQLVHELLSVGGTAAKSIAGQTLAGVGGKYATKGVEHLIKLAVKR